MRRKKCDEESPACRSCCRNGLTCIWSSKTVPADSQRDAVSRRDVNDSHRPSSDNPSSFECSSRESLFRYFASTMIPQLLIPGTPLASANELIPLAAQYPCVRDSFLACATLFLSNSDLPAPSHALTYYSDALRYTRRMIEQSRVKGTEDWLLLQALLLCIFEVSVPTTFKPGSKSSLIRDFCKSVLNRDPIVEPCPIWSVHHKSWR